jgi:hypothetical protein
VAGIVLLGDDGMRRNTRAGRRRLSKARRQVSARSCRSTGRGRTRSTVAYRRAVGNVGPLQSEDGEAVELSPGRFLRGRGFSLLLKSL